MRALHGCPCHWGAWQALAALAAGQDAGVAGDLPRHWARDFHLAQLSLEAQENDEALGRLQVRMKAEGCLAHPHLNRSLRPCRDCLGVRNQGLAWDFLELPHRAAQPGGAGERRGARPPAGAPLGPRRPCTVRTGHAGITRV